MKIIILGAGVAGAAAAIALAERGHAVQVYERRLAAGVLGAGVTLWPNATFVLEQLGVLPAIAAVAGQPTRMARFDPSDAPLGTIDIAAISAAMGRSTYSVLRRDLQQVLIARALAMGVAISYGRAGRAVGSDGDHAWVELEDGQRVTAELVIGADGRMSSVARSYVAPGATATYQAFVNWVGIADAIHPIVDDPGTIRDYWGVGLRFGIVPISSHLVYWAGGQRVAHDELVPGDLHEELRETFAGWPVVIASVLAASAPSSIRKLAVYDLEPMEVWHRSRVLVIGDAAHAPLPTSGQGACQALEDAWHLARSLPAAGEWEALEHALVDFTVHRQAKTRQITLAGRQLAHSLFHLDAEASRRRDDAARESIAPTAAGAMAAIWSRGLPLR